MEQKRQFNDLEDLILKTVRQAMIYHPDRSRNQAEGITSHVTKAISNHFRIYKKDTSRARKDTSDASTKTKS